MKFNMYTSRIRCKLLSPFALVAAIASATISVAQSNIPHREVTQQFKASRATDAELVIIRQLRRDKRSSWHALSLRPLNASKLYRHTSTQHIAYTAGSALTYLSAPRPLLILATFPSNAAYLQADGCYYLVTVVTTWDDSGTLSIRKSLMLRISVVTPVLHSVTIVEMVAAVLQQRRSVPGKVLIGNDFPKRAERSAKTWKQRLRNLPCRLSI